MHFPVSNIQAVDSVTFPSVLLQAVDSVTFPSFLSGCLQRYISFFASLRLLTALHFPPSSFQAVDKIKFHSFRLLTTLHFVPSGYCQRYVSLLTVFQVLDNVTFPSFRLSGSSSSGGGHVTELLLSHGFSAAGPLTPYNSSVSADHQSTSLPVP